MRKYLTRQRNLSWTKIIIASAIGVIGGVYVWKPFFESLDAERPKKIKVCHFRNMSISHRRIWSCGLFRKMNKTAKTVQPGGILTGNFNKILAFVGLGWFASMVVLRYVIKPYRKESKMKENEMLMNFLYDEQKKQANKISEFDE
ncbi:hypothetical protein QTP88_014028 [Uroleucon formosanum]